DRLDHAGVLADGDAVAETAGLGEGQQHPRPEVAEWSRKRETRDEREDRARSEERVRDLLGRGKDREDAPRADQHDERYCNPEKEAERRAPAGGDGWVVLGEPALVTHEREPQRETHADDDHDPYDSEDDRLYRVARGVHDGQFGAETAEPPRIRGRLAFGENTRFGGCVLLVGQRPALVKLGEGVELSRHAGFGRALLRDTRTSRPPRAEPIDRPCSRLRERHHARSV